MQLRIQLNSCGSNWVQTTQKSFLVGSSMVLLILLEGLLMTFDSLAYYANIMVDVLAPGASFCVTKRCFDASVTARVVT